MKMQKLSADLAGIAKDAIEQVGESIEHGRDAMGDSLDKGIHAIADASARRSFMSMGAKRVGQLAGILGAYTSLKSLGSALDFVPVDDVLGYLGLQRRRSAFASVMGGVGLVAAGAAVGAGVALLFAPQSGVRTRAMIDRRFRSMKQDARGAVRDAEVAAKDAVHRVEEKARDAVGSVKSAVGTSVGSTAPAGGPSAGQPRNGTAV